jgi:hypothetical protein
MGKEATPANPFQFGKPVTGELFCNRTRELARIAEVMDSRNSAWLHSPRRYGKTSLIREAFAVVEAKGLHTAYVDLQGLQAGLSVAELYLRGVGPLIPRLTGGVERALQAVAGFARSIVPTISLDEQGAPVLSVAPAARDRGAEPGLEEALDLPEKLAGPGGQRVVVAIDEFQEIARVAGLEARLRSAMQHHRHVTYLMAGSRASLLRDLFTSPERPFFQFAEHIPIEKIERGELLRYVLGRFATTGVDIGETTAGELVDLADCHPHFVQYFASVAWNLCREGVADDAGFVPRVVDRIASSLDPGFRMYFDGLAASQQRLLVHVAVRGGEALMSEDARHKGRLGGPSTVGSALAALEGKDVLSRRDDGWSFVNPGFALWIRERATGS